MSDQFNPNDPRFIANSMRGPGPIDNPFPIGDEINSPAHYKQGDIECIDAIESALTADEFRGYLKGNVIKYIWRERHKQQATAVGKANWYLQRLLDWFRKTQGGEQA